MGDVYNPNKAGAIARAFFQQTKQVVDFTVDGKCSNCAGCCSNRIPMTDGEVKRIKNHVKRKKIKPRTVKTVFDGPECIDMTCPFLEKGKGCIIYDIRPEMCKLFCCNKPSIQVFHELYENQKFSKELKTVFIRQEIFGEEI